MSQHPQQQQQQQQQNEVQQQQQQQQQLHTQTQFAAMQQSYNKPKYGPPSYIKPRTYHKMHEFLESQANKKLTDEYSAEVVQTLSKLETLSSVNPSMIDLQPEIQWFMRPFLLDFLIELHSSFRLQPQTLFLCLNIIDRYCAKRIVFKRHYQLVGCTALWIAGKYEDKKSRVPTLKELTTMCRNAYDEEMFVQMEMHILSTLEWSIGHPTLEDCLQLSIRSSNLVGSNVTPYRYNHSNNRLQSLPQPQPQPQYQYQHQLRTHHYLSSSVQDDQSASTLSAVSAVGRFLCELSLYDKFFLSVPTSLVAMTCNLLACSMLQIPTAANTLKDLLDEVIVEPKRRQLLQEKMKLKMKMKMKNQRNQTFRNQNNKWARSPGIPKHPLVQKPNNTLYSNTNGSNYSHQNQIDLRHSSVDEDLDLDYEDISEECDESQDEDGDDADDDDDHDDDDDYFYEDEHNSTNDTTFDEEIENKHPEIYGSFLSGLDENCLLTMKKVALMLIIQLNKATEVLTKKYEALGVIQVIRNFHSKNAFVIQTIHENKDNVINNTNQEQLDLKLVQIAEMLLQFPVLSDPELDTEDEDDMGYDTEEDCEDYFSSSNQHNTNVFNGGFLNPRSSPHPFSSSTLSFESNNMNPPVTPPSATSQYSLFSNKRTCTTGGSQTTINSMSERENGDAGMGLGSENGKGVGASGLTASGSNGGTPTHFPISSFQPPQLPISRSSSLRRAKSSKIQKKRTGPITGNVTNFSPIKSSVGGNNSTTAINTSSPLMNQHF